MNTNRPLALLLVALACALPAASASSPADAPRLITLNLQLTHASTRASFYSEECRGLPMANGRPFNPDLLTCASWDYPLGTVLEVSSGGRSVQVTVTDRGPARRLVAKGIVIDLTRAAFESLGSLDLGHLPVEIARVR